MTANLLKPRIAILIGALGWKRDRLKCEVNCEVDKS
jgi:hypothetical protein